MRAAVLTAVGSPLEICELSLIDTPPGHVRVDMAASGVCHSDVSIMNGTIPVPPPYVMGHEGAGVVIEVGTGVTALAVGDHVILSFVTPCGTCRSCLRGQPNLCRSGNTTLNENPPFRLGNEAIRGTPATFAEEAIVPQNAAIKIADDVPLDVAALIGCGVMTGVGAAINTAQVKPGSTVCVFGAGGVGNNVIQGAKAAGAAVIVAVDLVESKRELAQRFGATHAVHPDDLPAAIAELTEDEGFDYAFEVIGLSSTMRAAYDATRRGGTAVIVGAGKPTDMVSFNALELIMNEKAIVPSMYGSADVRRDFHRILAMWSGGQLDLDGLITRRIKLDDVNDAFRAMEAGEVIRSVIV
jgi:S-(hydroxymethyl)glutathione dehydrogenase/alcohol dehydrogenase